MKNQVSNYAAIAVCTLITMVIPAVWYGLFSDVWMQGNGLSMDIIESGHSPYPYIIAFVSSLVGALTLSYLTINLGANTLLKGVMVGLLMGLAFCVIPLFTQNAFSFKPNSLSMIDGGVNLLNWVIVGGILGAWKKYSDI